MAPAAPSVSAQLIQLAPEIRDSHANLVSAKQDFFKAAFDGGALEPKTRGAVALAAALVQGNEETVRSFLAVAKQLGLNNEEVGQVAGIVAALTGDEAQRPSAQAAAATTAAPAKKTNTCC
ncbi:carboxymuconolactone decarboxylase family protein [Lentzea sp. NPDC004789]